MPGKIFVNGKEKTLESEMNISRLLQKKNIRPSIVTVEVNDEVVERKNYDSVLLKNGDRVEIVFFIGGGREEKRETNTQTRNFNQSDKKCGRRVAQSILDLIGNTPMVKLNRIVSDKMAEIYAKLESYSPGGSVKDRIALSMIEAAEKEGKLKPGSIVVEPTSGNTGIGLAMVCAVKGYKCILTMPESMSLERIYILKSFGAEIVLTQAIKGMMGAVKKAEEIAAKTRGVFVPQQFKNPANPEIHRQTTAREILVATNGEFDALVTGVGTGGTITGVGEVIKREYPQVKIIAVEPHSSAVLSGKPCGPHKIQGIGAGFVPDVLNRKIIDEIVMVKDEEAYNTTQRLAKEEGIFAGISSGAATFAALKIARDLGKGKRVVVILPDTGERYFSIQQYFEI